MTGTASTSARIGALLVLLGSLAGCSGTATSGHLDTTAAPPSAAASTAPVPGSGVGGASAAGSRPPRSSTATPRAGAAFTDPALVRTILADAGRDIVATNTYDYRTLTTFLTTGSAAATGAFRTQFRRSVTTVLRTQAPKVRQTQTAKVNAIGVGSASGVSASALVLGQLSVTNSSTRTSRVSAFQAVVNLRLVSGRWLIAAVATNGSLRSAPPGTPALAAATSTAASGAVALTSYRVKGGFDLSATVRARAVTSAAGSTADVLVSLDGRRSDSSTPNPQNLRVTVVLRHGRWLLSKITAVTIS